MSWRSGPTACLLMGATFAGAPALALDLAILRDGTTISGALRNCTSDFCWIDGRQVPVTSLAWLGFGVAGAPPPIAPATLTVILRDGRSAPGPIVGISLGVVATDADSFDRDAVAWVFFAAPDSGGPPAEPQPSLPSPSAVPARPTPRPVAGPPRAGPGGKPRISRLPGVPDDPPPSAQPPPDLGVKLVAGPLLSEITIAPTAGLAAIVELWNAGAQLVKLDGLTLTAGSGAKFDLPPKLVIEPGGFLLVQMSGDFSFAGEAGSLALSSRAGLIDAVYWGGARPWAVSTVRGGRDAPPPAGSVLARRPGAKRPRSTGDWALLLADQSSPGAANPASRVSAFAGLPGAIFRGRAWLSWYGVAGAARYRVEIARDESFTNLVESAEVAASPGRSLHQEVFEPAALAPGQYWWRLQAVAADGAAAPFSDARGFAVSTAATGATAGAVGPSQQAVRRELAVPIFQQRKDTAMLMLEPVSEFNPMGWDTPDPSSSRPYCARAAIANVVAFHGGGLSLDRIGYEAFKDEAPGPELDLPETGMRDAKTSKALGYALGTEGDYRKNLHTGGGDSAACAEWSTARGCGVTVICPECPTNVFYRFGFEMIADIKREIDANRPLIASNPGHVFVISGYVVDGDDFYMVYLDAGGRSDVRANVIELVRELELDSYWTGLAPVDVKSDEPEVRADADGDGVVDFDEIRRFRTHPQMKDSDQDGVDDKQDIRASVFDPRYGYGRNVRLGEVETIAASVDPRGRDFDADGKAMELDEDSDDGGCLDGGEDFDGDGKFEEPEGEYDNFEKSDDSCITGTHEIVIDSTAHFDDSSSIHQRRTVYARYSLELADDGTLEGEAQMSAVGHGQAWNNLCPGTYQAGPWEWSAELLGAAQVQADGSLAVSFSATPERGPDYLFQWIMPGCPSEPQTWEGQLWHGWGGAFPKGASEIEKRDDWPLPPGQTGEFYSLTRMRKVGTTSPRP